MDNPATYVTPNPYGMEPKPYPNNPRQHSPGEIPFLNVVLTPEELKILHECRSNAMLYRGLPFGALVTGGYYYMMEKGLFRKSPFGMMFSGFLGFICGTISSRRQCMEKMLALPNSTLRERILVAQGLQPQVRVDVNSGDSFFDSVLPSSELPTANSSLDIGPYQSNQFDNYQDFPPLDTEAAYAINPPLQPVQRENFTSYDELRRRNRDEYEKNNRMAPGGRGPAPSQSSSYYSPPSSGYPMSRSPAPSAPYNSPRPYDNTPPAGSDRSFDPPSQPPSQSDDFRW